MKKIFRLTAMAAMVSMMATTATFTSCSDDDDDDDNTPTPVVDYTKTFSGEVGGTESAAGSFISVMDGKIYSLSDIKGDAEKASHVEIVFDGSKFVGANESINDVVNQNGCAAVVTTVTKGKEYKFTTNGGENGKSYSGIIEVDGEMSGAKATVKIEVSAK